MRAFGIFVTSIFISSLFRQSKWSLRYLMMKPQPQKLVKLRREIGKIIWRTLSWEKNLWLIFRRGIQLWCPFSKQLGDCCPDQNEFKKWMMNMIHLPVSRSGSTVIVVPSLEKIRVLQALSVLLQWERLQSSPLPECLALLLPSSSQLAPSLPFPGCWGGGGDQLQPTGAGDLIYCFINWLWVMKSFQTE